MSDAPRAAPPHLSIERVVKRFGPGVAAVDGVSLDLAAGEFFALLGPSGCGKTTLLRVLAGFETPDEGRILIDGADMAHVPPYARPVNMMFQSYALFPHMTAAENVAFGLRQEKLPKAEIARRVESLLDLVQMKRLAARKPGLLSGGEKQRVALARALAKEPKLLLLDEPLTALDRKLREETRFELIRIQKRVGITFLMVTHDQDEAMTMAQRIAVMNEGRIVQLGHPRAIYEHPASRFVAGFIGSVNLFECRVEAVAGGTLQLSNAEAGAVLRATSPRAFAAGTVVALAVRPEKLLLSKAADDSLPNRLAGTLRAVAYRGAASDYEIELASGRRLRATRANAEHALPGLAAGQAVWLGFAADSAVVLDS